MPETSAIPVSGNAGVSPVGTAPVVTATRGGGELVEGLGDEWRALCAESSDDQPFYRPEWVGAYVRAYVPPGKLLLFTARAAGKLTGVLPMVRERVFFSGIPARRLRGPSVLSGWRFDLVRRAGGEGDAAVAALWKFLRDFPGWDVLEFPDVVEGGAAEGFVRAAQADGFPTGRVECMHTPYIPLSVWDGTEDFWLRQTRPNFHSQVRRRMKRLTSQGPLELRRYDAADPELLQRFYALEASGWKGREASAIANNQTRLQFFTDLARGAARYGYLTLYFLEHNGRPIAADFGLTYRGCYSAPKGAYDERYRQYGPGHLLVNAVLRDCAERGLTEYNLLAHAEEWKLRWTSRYRAHAYWYVFRSGAHSHLVRFAKLQAAPFLKRVLGRDAGFPRADLQEQE